MQKLFAVIAITVVSFTAFIAVGQSKKDPKASEILKGVSAKYKSSKAISASFKVTSVDQKNKTTDTQTGSILLKGNKYHLSLKGQEIYSDGKTNWTFIKESNEVQVNDADTKSDAITPTNIFTIYEKGFSTKYTGDAKVDNADVQQIELVPDDNKKSYFKILLNINKDDKVISSAKIFEKGGMLITYSVEKLKMNTDFPDESFVFDASKHPGVEVVDLR